MPRRPLADQKLTLLRTVFPVAAEMGVYIPWVSGKRVYLCGVDISAGVNFDQRPGGCRTHRPVGEDLVRRTRLAVRSATKATGLGVKTQDAAQDTCTPCVEQTPGSDLKKNLDGLY